MAPNTSYEYKSSVSIISKKLSKTPDYFYTIKILQLIAFHPMLLLIDLLDIFQVSAFYLSLYIKHILLDV